MRRGCCDRPPFDVADAVREEGQAPSGSDTRIELPQRSGGGVTRVCEQLLPARCLRRVERGEVVTQHQHFPPHLDPRRHSLTGQAQRYRAHRAQVGRHVLAAAAIAARRAGDQHALHVAQADRESVELRLGQVLDVALAQCLPHPSVESPRLVLVERVVERQHRQRVHHGLEGGGRSGAHALRRGIGRGQRRKVELERLQLAQERIEFGVADNRRVENVIAVVVRLDLAPQDRGPLRGRRGNLRRPVARHAEAPPERISRRRAPGRESPPGRCACPRAPSR